MNGKQLCLAVGMVVIGAFYCVADVLPATATWTGGGDRTNYADSTNWVCRDADGNVLPGKIPVASTTVVTVAGDTNFTCPADATKIWKSLALDTTINLTADCDWRGLGSLAIPNGATIDVCGYKLWLTDLKGTSTITDTMGSGELHLDVAKGVRVTNTAVALAGQLKLVKEGEGEFLSSRSNQSYTGGTAILAGKAIANDVGTTHRYGAAGSEIFVGEGASMEFDGREKHHEYTFVLNGGKLLNSTQRGQPWTVPLLSSVRLEADSSIDFNGYGLIGNNFGPTSLDLNGHTLDVTYSGNSYFSNVNATEGRIVIHGNVEFYSGDFVGTNTTLDVDAWMTLRETDVHVGTYIARATSTTGNQNGDIFVYKRFQPITDNFWGCVMKDGSTLDLSTRTAAWNVKGNLVSSNGSYKKFSVTFESGATIYVDLHGRFFSESTKIISWTDATKPPANVVFKPTGPSLCTFDVRDDGLFIVRDQTAPFYAMMKDDGSGQYGWHFYDVNWSDVTASCGLAEPTVDMMVGFESSAEYEAIKASGCAATCFNMSAFTVTDDVDLTSDGFAFTTEAGLSIDLQGHAMTVPPSFFTGEKTVTDSVGGGELRVTVSSGRLTNTDVALTGALKLVKSGGGEFLSNRANQTYTGGTAILAGKAIVNDIGTTHRYGAAGSEIFVGEGASMEFDGRERHHEYTFVLNGGKLLNSTQRGQPWTVPLLSSVRLEADSSIDFNGYGLIGNNFGPTSLDLNGHTLDVTYSGNSYFSNVNATEGRIVIHGNVEFYSGDFVGTNTTLDVDAWMTLRETDVHVGTYIARATSTKGNQNGDIFVYRRFQPITDNFWGCVMKNGSTLDLSTRTEAWNVKGNLTSENGSYKKFSVTFEDGATIYVDLGSRTVLSNDKVVAWTANEKPPANVIFTSAAGSSYEFDVRDDGLYVLRDLAAPIYAKMKDDGSGTYGWHFYDLGWNDVTASCGLTEPTYEIMVCFDSSAEFEAIKVSGCPAAGYRMTGFTVTDDVDLTVDGFNLTTDVGLSIDLKGYTMTVPPSFFTGEKTVTDSVGGGELRVTVSSGRLTNADVMLTGALKLVKDGAGEFLSNCAFQTYTGGTAVLGGTLILGGDGTTHRYGAVGSEITVGEGATLDLDGRKDLYDYTFVLNGGTLKNTNTTNTPRPWEHPMIKSVRLETNSTMNITYHGLIGESVGSGKFGPTSLDLNGHTLELSGVDLSYLCNTTVTAGRINLHGHMEITFGDLVGLDTTLDLDAWLTLRESNVYIGTYIARATVNTAGQNGDIFVYKRFQPITDNFWGCVMKSGSTLDLSTRTAAWNVKGALSGSGFTKTTVTFEIGSTITVDLGSRNVMSEDKIISWTDATKPSASVVFNPVDGSTYAFEVRSDGLYVVRDIYAKLKDDGTGTYAWRFYDMKWHDITEDCELTEPTDAVRVCFDSSAEFEAIKASGCSAAGYRMTGFTVTDDVDLTSGGFDFTTDAGLSIDLKGHAMTVPPSFFTGEKTVTDSVGGGELRVTVSSGRLTNTDVALTGALKLVKSGAGEFVSSRSNQSYTGGTAILAGKAIANDKGTSYRYGAAGSEIFIDKDASFEFGGKIYFHEYQFVLNGGTLMNSTQPSEQHWKYPLLSSVRLEADSTFIFGNYGLIGDNFGVTSLDLKGHTLDVTYSGNSYFSNVNATEGRIVIHGNVEFYSGDFVGTNTTLDVDAWMTLRETDVHVGTYIARATSTIGNQNGDIFVYRRFQPITDNFWGCVMKNGSTLDLSTRTEAWNVKGNLVSSNGSYKKFSVTFEDGATITVDLGDRDVRSGDKIVSWTDDTKPSTNVKFKAVQGGYELVRGGDGDGLYVLRGLTIFIR